MRQAIIVTQHRTGPRPVSIPMSPRRVIFDQKGGERCSLRIAHCSTADSLHGVVAALLAPPPGKRFAFLRVHSRWRWRPRVASKRRSPRVGDRPRSSNRPNSARSPGLGRLRGDKFSFFSTTRTPAAWVRIAEDNPPALVLNLGHDCWDCFDLDLLLRGRRRGPAGRSRPFHGSGSYHRAGVKALEGGCGFRSRRSPAGFNGTILA
jgi:hypothetical protein